MSNEYEIQSVEIYAGTGWEAALVKSLLENAEVEAFLKDEFRGTLAPWQVSPGGAAPVKVIVSSADYTKAKLIVDDFKKSIEQS